MIDVIIAFPGMGKTAYAKYGTFQQVFDFELKDFKTFREFAMHVRKTIRRLIKNDQDAALCFGMQPQVRELLSKLKKQYDIDLDFHFLVPNVPISQWVPLRLNDRSEDFQLEILSKGESYIIDAVKWAEKNNIFISYTSATVMEVISYHIGFRDAY